MSVQFGILADEVGSLTKNKALDKCVEDSQGLLTTLRQLEADLAEGKDVSVAQLGKEVKQWSDKTVKNEKSLNTAMKKYGKTVDKVFTFSYDDVYNYKIPMSDETNKLRIDRSIIMHMLREGKFDVASSLARADGMEIPETISRGFDKLHSIHNSLVKDQDLSEAIEWAVSQKERLDSMGSDLGFNLHKLQFLKLYNSGVDDFSFAAYSYAKRNFQPFGGTHLEPIAKLMSAILYPPGDAQNPYQDISEFQGLSYESLFNQLSGNFCSLLGLTSESPLYSSLLTSYIAIPQFIKFNNIFKNSGGKLDWTTKNELPFEINLPEALQFHSIFICPVSREETTVVNPPMMLPCRHILSKESLDKLAKNSSSFKCPYCPTTCVSSQAIQVNFVSLSEYK